MENPKTWGPLEKEVDKLLTQFNKDTTPALSLVRRLADFIRAREKKLDASLDQQLSELRQENDKLRGLLAKGKGPCAYCQLPAEEIAKCKSGFPGCARMDDIMFAVNTERENQLEDRVRDLLDELHRRNDGAIEGGPGGG